METYLSNSILVMGVCLVLMGIMVLTSSKNDSILSIQLHVTRVALTIYIVTGLSLIAIGFIKFLLFIVM